MHFVKTSSPYNAKKNVKVFSHLQSSQMTFSFEKLTIDQTNQGCKKSNVVWLHFQVVSMFIRTFFAYHPHANTVLENTWYDLTSVGFFLLVMTNTMYLLQKECPSSKPLKTYWLNLYAFEGNNSKWHSVFSSNKIQTWVGLSVVYH